MTDEVSPASTDAGDTSRSARRSRFLGRRRRIGVGVLVVLAAVVLLHGLVFETFTVPSASMNPALRQGDRIVVAKIGTGALRRGEVVVFDGTQVFARPGQARSGGVAAMVRGIGDTVGVRPTESLYVKRVIGLPGDRVAVGKDGKLRVNAAVRPEPYLPRGMSASTTPFSAVVPAGHVFVLGDNRPNSQDSRAHLGDPGGGMVPLADIIGEVRFRYWPTASWGRLAW